MSSLTTANFSERERDALVLATASDADILELCAKLWDDPSEVAKHVRELLLDARFTQPSEVKLPSSGTGTVPLPFPSTFAYQELLPLHRVLLVDDDPERLSTRLEEFRRHQFKLGFAIETASNGEDAISRLQDGRFDAVFIELSSLTHGTRWILEGLRKWSTPLPPVVLESVGMDVFELRRLNRNAIRALASGLGKKLPSAYRKGLARAGEYLKKPAQSEGTPRNLFDVEDKKQTG